VRGKQDVVTAHKGIGFSIGSRSNTSFHYPAPPRRSWNADPDLAPTDTPGRPLWSRIL